LGGKGSARGPAKAGEYMTDWNPDLYLRFKRERNQPLYDLISRIEIDAPERIIDIGCGPGNSTQVLRDRWPRAEIIGIDSSRSMIEKATSACPGPMFMVRNACDDLSDLGGFDLVFANASLQWMPDQEHLVPRLFNMLRPKGVFAAQIPQYDHMPVSKAIDGVVSSPKWAQFFNGVDPGFNFHTERSYYEWLCEISTQLQMWTTDYYHIMDSHDRIVEMMGSTGLKTYLSLLPGDKVPEFTTYVLESIKAAYPNQCDGKVMFPFKRLFVVATKGQFIPCSQ